MPGTCVICLEGVLVKDSAPNGPPVWVGLQLYAGLRSQFRIVIDSNHGDYTEIEHWLRVNDLNRHSLVLNREPVHDTLDEVSLRTVHLGEWRAQGYDVALYVTADPAVAKRMMHGGVPVLLFAHPQFARPEYRPEAPPPVQRWADIEAEITAQALLKKRLPRVDAEMESDA